MVLQPRCALVIPLTLWRMQNRWQLVLITALFLINRWKRLGLLEATRNGFTGMSAALPFPALVKNLQPLTLSVGVGWKWQLTELPCSGHRLSG